MNQCFAINRSWTVSSREGQNQKIAFVDHAGNCFFFFQNYPNKGKIIKKFFINMDVGVSLHTSRLIPRFTEHPASPVNK